MMAFGKGRNSEQQTVRFIYIWMAAMLFVLSPVPPAGTIEAATEQIRIMPLGDSLTKGYDNPTPSLRLYNGYRRSLHLSLTGFPYGYDVNLVGSQTDGSFTDYDRNHEGYNGRTADQVRDQVLQYLTDNPADIILLHIGTNDLGNTGQAPSDVVAEIEEILDNIDTFETNNAADITVFLARIINVSNPGSPLGLKVTELNGLIQSMAVSRIASGDRIVVVDHEGALTYPGDLLSDGIHPTPGGYDKMADAWLEGLTDYLPGVENLEVVASSPGNLTEDDLTCSYDLTGSSSTTAATAWIRNGTPIMSLYMPFEGGAANGLNDYSGNGNDGINGGDPTWQPASGFDGNGSFEFDGNGDFISAGSIMPTGAYTKSAWVYLEPGETRNNIISGSSEHAFWITDYQHAPGQLYLRAGHSADWDTVKDTEVFAPNAWTFVGVSYDPSVDGGTMVLYKNGTEVDRNTGVGPIPTDQSVFIGAFNGTTAYFRGFIDDARIYDHALSPDQMAALHGTGRDAIVASETNFNDTWQCQVTPFSSTLGGPDKESNMVTIEATPVPPVITSSPVLEASVGVPYSYDVEATGFPLPGYGLQVPPSPDDMTIDPVTGLISWTPSALGAYDVAVEATNTAGSIVQAFTIHVSECPADLTAYYKLDETAAPFVDATGGTSATCSNCPTPTSGIAGGAQQMDGTNDEITVADNNQFEWGQNDSFSIEFWMKKDSPCGGAGVAFNEVVVGRDSASNGLHWWAGVLCDGNGVPGRVNFTLDSNNGDRLILDNGSTVVTDGLWHHVVAVRDGAAGENRLYVDGALDDSGLRTYGSGFDAAVTDLTVGWLNAGGGFRYDGIVDEIALYDRAISAAEIVQHYNNGINDSNGYCQEDQCTGGPDTDGDGVNDTCDNCVTRANGPDILDPGLNIQLDTDGDGIGNMCDCDFNNDDFCGGPDFTIFIGCFNRDAVSAACLAADMNGDGFVGGPDFSLFIGGFNQDVSR